MLLRAIRSWDHAINPLNPELNPICYLLALLGAHHFLHVSRIRVKSLTLRQLMFYIYMEHLFLMFLDHTQRRTTVGSTPLDEWSAPAPIDGAVLLLPFLVQSHRQGRIYTWQTRTIPHSTFGTRSIYQPTYALNKIQFITCTELRHVSSSGCHF